MVQEGGQIKVIFRLGGKVATVKDRCIMVCKVKCQVAVKKPLQNEMCHF